jgi:dihydroorotase-like cyclic amidohydrolase
LKNKERLVKNLMEKRRIEGFIDDHAHLREPGINTSENFDDGTAAAVSRGVVIVCDMPNTIPIPTATPEFLDERQRIASKVTNCDLAFYYLAMPGGANVDTFPLIRNKAFAIKAFLDNSTGGYTLNTPEERDLVVRSMPDDMVLIGHAEEGTLIPFLELGEKHGKRLHVAHVDSAESIKLIAMAQKRRPGMVTAEACIPQLFLTEADISNLAFEGAGRMRPPLPDQQNQDALWKAIRQGIIQTIGTDHAPHPLEAKLNFNPKSGPYGVPGLEVMSSLLLTAVHQGKITFEQMKKATWDNPRDIFGLPTPPNTWVEVDLDKVGEIHASEMLTKCGWTPYEGMQTVGAVTEVVYRGRLVSKNGNRLTYGSPNGRVLLPY